jgi:hypothetical protein
MRYRELRRAGSICFFAFARKGGAIAWIALTMVAAASTRADPTILQPDIKNWVSAAQTSRADILFVGDSIARAFNEGFSTAAAAHFGLAGTGIASDANSTAAGWTITPPYPLGTQGWDNSLQAVPSGAQGFVSTFGEPSTAGATPGQNITFYLNPHALLDNQAAYDWHVWTASPPGVTGSMQARRLLAQDNYATLQTDDPIATSGAGGGATPLQHSVFHFDALSGHDSQITAGNLYNVTNTSVLYSRLLKPGATGVTVTSWQYGGHTALDMYNDKYLGTTTQAGRAAYLNAVTDGGSGKLMVVLEEGTNDATSALANTPSVHGILPGNSPAAFQDNMASLIDGFKSDWAAAGKDPSDLSFLVLGMYQYGNLTDADQLVHRQYAQELEDLAHTRSDVSFIDLYDIAPPWDQAYAMGYMADGVHATDLGATVYSQAIFDQIVPEPGALAALSVPLVVAALGRRRGPRRDGR